MSRPELPATPGDEPADAAVGTVGRLIDRLLPTELLADAEDRRRSRVLVGASLLLAIVGGVFLFNALRVPTTRVLNIVALGGITVVFGAVPWVLRRSGRVRSAGIWACGWTTVFVGLLVWSGGLFAPALMWLPVLPLLGQFFVGPRFAKGMLATCLLVGCVAYGRTLTGRVGALPYAGDDLTHLVWLSNATLILAVAGLAGLYDHARQRALQLQHEVHDRLREANERLAHARDEAEATSRAKSVFLATVSHELRTPLHGVLAMTSTLTQRKLDPATREQVGLADRAARTLQVLIEDLLQLSAIDAGSLKFHPRPWHLREGIGDLAHIFELKAQAKGIALHAHVGDAVPTRVVVDPLRVQQVVANVLANAVKFTDAGEVHLDVAWRADGGAADSAAATRDPSAAEDQPGATPPSDAAARGTLVVTVTDTGPGIAEAHQASIFAPFSSAHDGAERQRHGGTGLGLSIAQQLLDRMGGRISVESEVQRGSRFVIEVPCSVAKRGRRAPAQPSERLNADARPRVLVADDNPVCRDVLAQLLDALGCESTLVVDGQAAVDACASERFDVVLMDCEMPVLDGLAAAAQLRATADPPPIVAVTAHGQLEQQERCLDAGMSDVLAKPFRVHELRKVLLRWLPAPAQARMAALRTTNTP